MPGSIGAIIGSFNSEATKRFYEISHNPETQLWRRNYYERFIRNKRDYEAIFEYILSNPLNWEMDEEFLLS